MKTQIKNFGKAGVCFFLMSGMVHAQTTKKDSLNEKKIDEVVVVGYKKQRKETLTSSVSSVNSKELLDQNTVNFQTMLQGKMPGVVVTSSSGQPGSKPNMRIRGFASLAGTNDPLYVVDGVITHGNDVAASEIEDVTVLKDAAATALYGSRGANGVVVITTKSGKGNSIRASLNNSFKFFNKGNFKVMNSAQQKERFLEFSANGADIYAQLSSKYGQNITSLDQITTDYNWLDAVTQVGVTNDFNLSFSKSSDGSKNYVNVGYYREEGTLKGYKLDRFTARLNNESKLNSWLTVSPKLNFIYDKIFNQEYDLFSGVYKMPWDNPFDPNGKPKDVIRDQNIGWFSRDRTNFFVDRPLYYGKTNTLQGQGNLDFEIKLAKNLKFVSTNGVTYYNSNYFSYSDPRLTGSTGEKGGAMYESDAIRWTSFTNQKLAYENTWNDKHKFNALIAYEYMDYTYRGNWAGVSNIIVGSNVLSNAAASDGLPGGQKNQYAFQSILSNAEYSFDDRYLVQASLRSDESSRFPKKHRRGTFWAVSAGWNVNNEAFWHDYSDVVNKWKLRISYGAQGNVPGTNYYGEYNVSSSRPYNSQIGVFPTQLGNPDLKWEVIKQLNVGTDISLFKNRINVVFDWYNKNTEDLILNVSLPYITGFPSKLLNVGKLRNRGFEIGVNADIIKTKDFTWNMSVNISKNNTVFADLYGSNNNVRSGMYRNVTGGKAFTYDLREWAGVNPTTGAAQWTVYYIDSNKNGVFDDKEQISSLEEFRKTGSDAQLSKGVTDVYARATYIHFKDKSRLPDFTGGISTSFTYKNWTLSANGYFSKGGYIYNTMRQNFLDSDGVYPFYNAMPMPSGSIRWSKNNTPEQNANATHPALKFDDRSNPHGQSTRYLEDGSFFKIRTISVAYDFPKNFMGDIFKGARISLNFENMFMFTKFSGITPELADSDATGGLGAGSYTNYPAPRAVTVGFDLSF
ncbi:SusC/RagA family TonB-linked outer membrane protein [Elizabethkingia anophelis]|uniref:SusC/RagA family TonB-linked outer membrane protein n=1 Tax=Elizabethkingia anophelis TaxID=1117645 RepID=UPI0038925B32